MRFPFQPSPKKLESPNVKSEISNRRSRPDWAQALPLILLEVMDVHYRVLLALEFRTVFWAIFLALVLAVGLWVPYLYKEIREERPRKALGRPIGAGDTHPGRRGDPAPGQTDAQADPYDPRAQR